MEKENYEYKDQKIVDIVMEKEVKSSFIQYAMSVIMQRALPDIRDGLKPVHRRILYAMYEDHLTYNNPFRKSATTVGNVLGRYHPHGDASVYDSMVRLAQPFSLRYPLIEGHGNFGNIDGDQAAAYRYTEARMSKMADEMLADIDKNTVDFQPNFDNKHPEPTVLPCRFPNLLVNGTMGIAVGMATNIPPHNLGEVIDGTTALIDNPDITIPELMEYIKGPDFPTGAAIYGTNGIVQAYMTGKGRLLVRSKAHIEEEKHRIVITEIPYALNKIQLVQNMADCINDKRIEGATDLRDESDKDGLRIVVDYRHDANGQIILNQLYKYTLLQSTFAVNMLALVNNEPKILNLKQMLEYYIKHQEDVIVRRVRFELDKALKEAHLNEGYKFAIDNIDEVIRIIRASGSVSEAKAALMARFTADDVANMIEEEGAHGLSDAQAQAIVEMPLGRLAGMERQKIQDKLDALKAQIHELNSILADEGKQKEIIKNELNEIKRKFSDDRRTVIEPVEDEIVLEDLIEKHTCIITLTKDGYVKRIPSDTYTAQHRGGKGIIGMTTKEDDIIIQMVAVNSHSTLLMFTNKGKIHCKKAYYIPETSRTAKGSNAVNIIDLEEGEKITAIISTQDFADDESLVMVTEKGTVKRTMMSEFRYQRKGGKKAITLEEGDSLSFVLKVTGDEDVIIATANGRAARFNISQVRAMGRTAAGVRGIKLGEDDRVVGACVVDDSKMLLSITERGKGKRTEFSEYTGHNRGTQGMKCHGIGDSTGKLAGIAAVGENDDIMLITDDGNVIRTRVSEVSVTGRSAQGVWIMRAADDTKIANFTVISEEETEKAISEAEAGEEKPEEETGDPFDGEDSDIGNTDTDEDDI